MDILENVTRTHIGMAAAVIIVIGALALAGQESSAPQDPDANTDWLSTALTDVRNGESFTINQFDQPVVVETFAVWCTTCTRQQKEIQTLHEEHDGIVSVTLNTDPNEDADKVREHIDRHGFDWRYAVAPPAMIQDLINTFGRSITNAPLAPMVVVCPDGTTERLQNGVKPAETIPSAVDETCGQ